jgi:hypothetical protein
MSEYSDLILLSSPAGYWRLNDPSGTTATDLSGADRHGTYAGTFSLAQGALLSSDSTAGSADFTTNGKVNLPAGVNTAVNGAAAISLEAWVRVDSTSSTRGVASISTGANDGCYMAVDSNTAVYFGGRSVAADTFQSQLATVAATLNRVMHMVCVCDYANDKLYGYLDGVLVVNKAVSFANAVFTYVASSYYATIACTALSTGYFEGRIGDVAIYATALSASTVLAHYLAAQAPPGCSRGIKSVTGNYSVRHLGI